MRAIALSAIMVFFAMGAWAREWKDKTGKFSIEAQFQKLEDGTVTVKKESGEIIAVPLIRLCEADRQFVQETVGQETLKNISKAIRTAYRERGQAETTARAMRVEELKEEAAKKVFQQFTGRTLTVRFTITDVRPSTVDAGYYVLTLTKRENLPDATTASERSLRLQEADALLIDKGSSLIVTGTITLGDSDRGRSTLEQEATRAWVGYGSYAIPHYFWLDIDAPTIRIENLKGEKVFQHKFAKASSKPAAANSKGTKRRTRGTSKDN